MLIADTGYPIRLLAFKGAVCVNIPELEAYTGIPKLAIPGLASIPVIGNILFNQDGLVYLSIIMVFVVYPKMP